MADQDPFAQFATKPEATTKPDPFADFAIPVASHAPAEAPSGFMSDEAWAKLSSGEKLNNIMQWAGRMIGGAFIGPAGAEAADHPKTTLVTAAAGPLIQRVPRVVEGVRRIAGISSQRAGANMQAAMEAARDVPVQTGRAAEAIGRAAQLQATGSRMPRVVTMMQRRMAQSPRGELSFREAQDFTSSLSRMSVNDRNALTPQMERQLKTLRDAMRESLTESAEQVGAGEQYAQGVQEYAKAARAAEAWREAQKKIVPAVLHGAGAGAGGALIYKIFGGAQKK